MNQLHDDVLNRKKGVAAGGVEVLDSVDKAEGGGDLNEDLEKTMESQIRGPKNAGTLKDEGLKTLLGLPREEERGPKNIFTYEVNYRELFGLL